MVVLVGGLIVLVGMAWQRQRLAGHWWTHRLLAAEDAGTRRSCFDRLTALGSYGAVAVEDLLQSPRASVRALGVVLVNQARPARGRELLAGMVADADPEVAALAVSGLGTLGDRRALEDLRRAARMKDERLAVLAVVALGRLRASEAVEALMETARDDPRVRVRVQAIEELGQLGDARAVPVLRARLEDREPFAGQTFWEQSAVRLMETAGAGVEVETMPAERPVSFFARRALVILTGYDVGSNGAPAE